MKNKLRSACLGLVVGAVLFMLSGCRYFLTDAYEYRGGQPELFSVALHSILGSKGYTSGEVKHQPELEIIEKDEYGRVLFLYSEDNPVSTLSLVICQKSTDSFAYFYPDINFISISAKESEEPFRLTEADFEKEEIERLKEENDWGQEITIDACVRAAVSSTKEEGPVERVVLKKFYNQALGEDAHGRAEYIQYFISDSYGRSLYLIHGKGADPRQIVLIFQPDDSYNERRSSLELEDLQNYQKELKQFKARNGWEQPVSK